MPGGGAFAGGLGLSLAAAEEATVEPALDLRSSGQPDYKMQDQLGAECWSMKMLGDHSLPPMAGV